MTLINKLQARSPLPSGGLVCYRIAGIDVHKKMLAVVVANVAIEGEYEFERRQFGGSPDELRRLADWLIEQKVQEVVMESTAQYWRPVWHTLDSFRAMAGRVTAEFENLKVIASTVRRPHTANRNGWSAFGYAEGEAYEGLRFDDLEILDRVGGGDSFASGLIYGLLQGKGMRYALDCGIAHGALAMTTAGDSSMATLPEVERLMAGGSAGTVR